MHLKCLLDQAPTRYIETRGVCKDAEWDELRRKGSNNTWIVNNVAGLVLGRSMLITAKRKVQTETWKGIILTSQHMEKNVIDCGRNQLCIFDTGNVLGFFSAYFNIKDSVSKISVQWNLNKQLHCFWYIKKCTCPNCEIFWHEDVAVDQLDFGHTHSLHFHRRLQRYPWLPLVTLVIPLEICCSQWALPGRDMKA